MSEAANLVTGQRQIYVDCLEKQIDELEMLKSIYCGAGELEIFDPLYVCEFDKFLKDQTTFPANVLRTPLEFIVKLEVPIKNEKTSFEVRVQLPHLYPNLEHPLVTIQSALLNKQQTQLLKSELNTFIATMEKQIPYVYQLLTWIQENVETLLKAADERSHKETPTSQPVIESDAVDFERLWIYSHHIKAKSKRNEILQQSHDLNLSGFSRPGKPGIICVEGLKENTQEFWRIIKSLHWQKIIICKSEIKRTTNGEIDKLRRFEGFREQLFCENAERDDVVMNMGAFVKYLETHNSAYMKKELFGFD